MTLQKTNKESKVKEYIILRLFVLAYILTLNFYSSKARFFRGEVFSVDYNARIRSEYVIKTLSGASRLTCVAKCCLEDICEGLSFDYTTKRCEISSVRAYPSTVETSSGVLILSRTGESGLQPTTTVLTPTSTPTTSRSTTSTTTQTMSNTSTTTATPTTLTSSTSTTTATPTTLTSSTSTTTATPPTLTSSTSTTTATPTTLTSSTSTTTTTQTTTTTTPARDCYDILTQVGATTSGVYSVYVPSVTSWESVYCDMDTEGGGWTAFQRRQDGAVGFSNSFAQYKNGFGDPNTEYWLGLDTLHAMTSGTDSELRVEFTDFNGDFAYEKYDGFHVGPSPFYNLSLGDALFINTTEGTSGPFTDSDQTVICQFMSQTLGYSNQWNNNIYSANQVTGAPNVYPSYGDSTGTWCPSHGASTEYLEYRFTTPVRIINVTVYETNQVGSLTRIATRDQPADQWETLWSTSSVTFLTYSRMYSPPIVGINKLTTDIRLEVDVSMSWYQIDAMQVCGATNIVPYQSMKYNAGANFSTPDNDSDQSSNNCAVVHDAGWWFKDCTSINPNGEYSSDGSPASNNGLAGMTVLGWNGLNTVQSSKLMFRRKVSA